MDGTFWVVVVVGVVLAAVAAWALSRNLQSQRLRQRFGPEYERTVERESGDRRRAESALGERLSRRRQLDLRPLGPAVRVAYMERWDDVQAEFVDQPKAAVEHAQELLDEVMAERGYPVGEAFEARVDLISVDHPGVVEHYRVAHRLHGESSVVGDTAVTTEERRQALVHYRVLFADLLETGDADRGPDNDDSDDELDHEGRNGDG